MAVFTSTEEVNSIFEQLWHRIKAHPEMSGKLLSSRLVVQFRYREPEGLLTIDCSDGQEMRIIVGQTSLKPVIEMSMKSDIAHEFWLGRVNVPLAIISGKVVSKGPTPRALSLLPTVKPAFAIYPEILRERGKSALISGHTA